MFYFLIWFFKSSLLIMSLIFKICIIPSCRNDIINTRFSSVDIEVISSFLLRKICNKTFLNNWTPLPIKLFSQSKPLGICEMQNEKFTCLLPSVYTVKFLHHTSLPIYNAMSYENFSIASFMSDFVFKKVSLLMQVTLSDNFHFHVHDFQHCWKVYHLFKTFAFSSVCCLCPCPLVIDFLILSFTHSC